MNRYNDIINIIQEMEDQYANIEKSHNESLARQEINNILQVKIKNFFENARSILDYCACDIVEKYNINIPIHKIYFPILKESQSIVDFETIEVNKFYELKNYEINLHNYLESVQPYHKNYKWLGEFRDISNNNKHIKLSPQIIRKHHELILMETISLRDSKGTCFINCNINGVNVANSTFDADMDINQIDPRLKPQQKTWKEIMFDDINEPILVLLKNILDEIPKIMQVIYSYIN